MFHRQPWMQRAGEHPASDAEYFALLARAVFSAGLGPKVVESRWAGLEEAFFGFSPEAVSLMGDEDVSRLLADPAVIRNRRKIEAVIANARVFQEIVAEEGDFLEYLTSLAISEDLEAAADALSSKFRHLGRASAAFFLFSCGWRPKEENAEELPAPATPARARRARRPVAV